LGRRRRRGMSRRWWSGLRLGRWPAAWRSSVWRRWGGTECRQPLPRRRSGRCRRWARWRCGLEWIARRSLRLARRTLARGHGLETRRWRPSGPISAGGRIGGTQRLSPAVMREQSPSLTMRLIAHEKARWAWLQISRALPMPFVQCAPLGGRSPLGMESNYGERVESAHQRHPN